MQTEIPAFLKIGPAEIKQLEDFVHTVENRRPGLLSWFKRKPTLYSNWKANPMKRVIIESPFAGDIQANINYARQCAKDCVQRGEVPFASHLFFPQFLDDNKPEERQLGIEMGFDFWDKADLVVFYMDRGLSPGMEKALLKAFTENKPYERRQLQPQATQGPAPAAVAKFAPKVDMNKLAKDIAQK